MSQRPPFRSRYFSFSIVLPVFNHVKLNDLSSAYSLLLVPVGVQVALLAAGAVYSARSKHREVVAGTLWGFALEVAAPVVVIVVSTSAHY